MRRFLAVGLVLACIATAQAVAVPPERVSAATTLQREGAGEAASVQAERASAATVVQREGASEATTAPPEGASGWHARAPVRSRHAMVVAAHPLAADAALRMLRKGGSAADAAIAAQLVLGLVEPQSSGLGGGAFALYRDARRNRLVAYDGRETAPSAARPDRFLDAAGRPLPFRVALTGGRATGVPGVPRLLETLHRAHGRLPWRTLFGPAIALAEHGFAVSPRLAALLAAEAPFAQPRSRDYFFPQGAPLREGAWLRNPAYARTLRRLAAEGAGAFYRGPLAADIVATLDAAGANDLTRDDLARYRVQVRAPLCMSYRTRRVCTAPPPAGGIAVLEMLGLLQPYDIASMGAATFWSVHFVSEAGRLAYADRAYVADPAFAPLPFDLLDPRYLALRSRAIHATRTLGRAAPGEPPPGMAGDARRHAHAFVEGAAAEAPSTSQISIVDARGDALSITTSIEYAFGTRLMTEGGFLLNNELTDFAFVPVEGGRPVANRVEGGKRPRSAMSPALVLDARGAADVVVGSVGGPWIVNYVAQALVALLDWQLDAQAAVALPHFGSRNGPTELERGTFVAALAERLRALGHEVAIVEQTSGTNAIVRRRPGWEGGADPRREGVAVGE